MLNAFYLAIFDRLETSSVSQIILLLHLFYLYRFSPRIYFAYVRQSVLMDVGNLALCTVLGMTSTLLVPYNTSRHVTSRITYIVYGNTLSISVSLETEGLNSVTHFRGHLTVCYCKSSVEFI